MAGTWTLKARWLLPVEQPPIEGGTLTVAGNRIASVDRGPKTAELDLGDAIVLPGLVNAHTHLDLGALSALRDKLPPPADFTQWLRQVVSYRRQSTRDEWRMATQAGVAESLRSGTTLLGDIAVDGLSRPILSGSPLRSVVFHELIGLSRERQDLVWSAADEWLRGQSLAQRRTRHYQPGLSPHAPYSVGRPLLQKAAHRAHQDQLPLAIHWAETPFEEELLRRRSGPLRDFLEGIGAWPPDDAKDLASHLPGVLEDLAGVRNVLLIHANYPPALDEGRPAAKLGGKTVVYCPRTHAYFGHPPHPFPAYLQAGVNVALGTDSLASNPDLSILNEMRFLRRARPEVSAETIVQLATMGGARALGLHQAVGSLMPGKSADLVVVPLAETRRVSEDPYQLLLEGSVAQAGIRDVLLDGQWIVRDGNLKTTNHEPETQNGA